MAQIMDQYLPSVAQLCAGFAGLHWLLAEPAAYWWNAAMDQ